MKFTSEQLEKAKSAKSVDELMKFAEDEGIELTKEDAEKYLAFLGDETAELPDEALDEVAGGKKGHPLR